MGRKIEKIKWLKLPEDHDYDAAYSYLRLIFDDEKAKTLVNSLKDAKMTEFKAKDIFRASRENLLGISNEHIVKNIKKIRKGKELSPLLLIRDGNNGRVIIADGYHRVCSVYHFQEDIWIPCKII
jgi:hypothetical protein